MSIAERLVAVREKNGYTRKRLAEELGRPYRTITNYEMGEREPGHGYIVEIAKKFNVSTDYLLGKSDDENPTNKKDPPYSDEAIQLAKDYDGLDKHGQRVVRVVADEEKRRMSRDAEPVRAEREPVYLLPRYYSAMSAGTGDPSMDESPEYVHLIRQPPRGASYIAPINGISMEPDFHDGDQIFVDAQRRPRKGQVGVFYMDGRMWIKELGDGVLISHNPKYDPVPMTEDIQCQGLVLGVCDESYFA